MPRKRNVPESNDRLAHSQHPEGGQYVRDFLGYGTEFPMSNRAAADRTGINYVTISTLTKGGNTEFGTIIKFCKGFQGASINKMLALFGHEPLVFSTKELAMHGMLPNDWDDRKSDTGASTGDTERLAASMTDDRLHALLLGYANKYRHNGKLQDLPNEAIRICARMIMRLSDQDL